MLELKENIKIPTFESLQTMSETDLIEQTNYCLQAVRLNWTLGNFASVYLDEIVRRRNEKESKFLRRTTWGGIIIAIVALAVSFMQLFV